MATRPKLNDAQDEIQESARVVLKNTTKTRTHWNGFGEAERIALPQEINLKAVSPTERDQRATKSHWGGRHQMERKPIEGQKTTNAGKTEQVAVRRSKTDQVQMG
eukprot:2306927-Rhodomonas_salina.2